MALPVWGDREPLHWDRHSLEDLESADTHPQSCEPGVCAAFNSPQKVSAVPPKVKEPDLKKRVDLHSLTLL